jgi:hypothetical protein
MSPSCSPLTSKRSPDSSVAVAKALVLAFSGCSVKTFIIVSIASRISDTGIADSWLCLVVYDLRYFGLVYRIDRKIGDRPRFNVAGFANIQSLHHQEILHVR